MFRYVEEASQSRRQADDPSAKPRCWFPTTILVVVLALGALPRSVDAAGEGKEIPFDIAELFFELNDTDGDLGIHGMIDGGPWTRIAIEDPRERKLMMVWARGRLRKQAVTELFFESAEPTFDELDPEDFFARFPEGAYEVEGRAQNGQELESETEVTHTLPAPPEPSVNGQPLAEVCDEEDPGFEPTVVNAPVTIAWPEVTESHPDLGNRSIPVTINNYEVVVEVTLDLNGEEFPSVFSTVLPPGERSLTIPAEFLAQGETFKYEVLAREESFNQTAVESCFVVE